METLRFLDGGGDHAVTPASGTKATQPRLLNLRQVARTEEFPGKKAEEEIGEKAVSCSASGFSPLETNPALADLLETTDLGVAFLTLSDSPDTISGNLHFERLCT